MNFLEALESRWRGKREKRFLAEYGCETWEQYHRKYDPDFSYMSTKIKSIYHGYAHIVIPDERKYRWDEYDTIVDWCKERCVGKWRSDVHRVIYDKWNGGWELNGIGGSDYMFFAFKDPKDATLFLLRWS